MDERQSQELVAKAQIGADVRDFCRHPGYAILQKFISSKVADSRNEWLTAPTAQAAEEIRIKSKPYAEIELYLKRLIIEGEAALHNLRQEQEAL